MKNLDYLVNYIKNSGCNVRLYKRDELKESQCTGTFDIGANNKPIICLATKNSSEQELKQILLHEYGHYLQWRDGFLHVLEGPDLKGGWEIFDKWLDKRIELNKSELNKLRAAILLIEYDAEIRAFQIAKKLGIDIGNSVYLISGAYCYMLLIKWAFVRRKWGACPGPNLFYKKRFMSPRELMDPISSIELYITDVAQV